MQIYLDTANLREIRDAASWGILNGVTTNPSLVAKEQGIDHKTLITEITKLVDGPISAEAISLDAEGMIREGREFATWHPNVIVKVPITTEGLKAVSTLAKDGIRTNVTLCFNQPFTVNTVSPPKSWRPRFATPATSSMRPWPVPISPPAPSRCSNKA